MNFRKTSEWVGGSFLIRKIMLHFFGKGKALRGPISRTKAQHLFPKIGWGGEGGVRGRFKVFRKFTDPVPRKRHLPSQSVIFIVSNCETQTLASIGWVALSSLFIVWSSRIRDTSSHLHYWMFPSIIQTIYFLWGYDPGNMPVSTYLLFLSWAQFTVV